MSDYRRIMRELHDQTWTASMSRPDLGQWHIYDARSSGKDVVAIVDPSGLFEDAEDYARLMANSPRLLRKLLDALDFTFANPRHREWQKNVRKLIKQVTLPANMQEVE